MKKLKSAPSSTTSPRMAIWCSISALLALTSPLMVAQETADEKAEEAEPAPAKEVVSFDDLEKKLTVDETPIGHENGVMASYADMLEEVMPAVVTIYSSKEVKLDGRLPQSPLFDDPMFRRFFGVPEQEEGEEGEEYEAPSRREQGLGSGVVISKDGYILTNNHVIDGADEILVSLATDQRDYEAILIGSDPDTDVAIIKISAAADLKSLPIGNSKALRVGDVVLAVGNPFDLEQTVTSGIVSALGRSSLNITQGGFENFIQTDAAINRGNSGGALVDAHGRLVGINTAIQSGVSGGNIGIGFAIPSNMVLDIVERILDGGGKVRRGFLGVYLKELDSKMAMALGRDDKSGVLITQVGPDTPASDAGLKPNDLIVAYDGNKVNSMTKLRLAISNTAPGKEVNFDIIRNGKEKQVAVTLGDLEAGRVSLTGRRGPEMEKPAVEPEPETKLVEGVEIGELTDEIRAALELEDDVTGVVIESVEVDSAAAEDGLVAGMVVMQVAQKDVASVEEAIAAAEGATGALLLQIMFQGRVDITAVTLE